ncbi:hypothetical protein ASE36_04535 [Rhizobium sp. Root274]|uniref:hypothetical protein n=1 Tax=unclassified Rhizobium TaxID=2613769 RepID=UPI0007142B95|nr:MULTISPECIES: hypothetical protein [unclassified Rhizobium]KQW31514.1 hypothetical protein ASC71_04540 [Rhizobium sp. Root1240]KRD33055.1 hypothetical protein ASE36_04535 [Rhizobium sp. Root274]
MTLRTLFLSFSVAALGSLISTWPASGEEKLAWHGWSGDGAAQLVYGVAESDHVLLSFACEQSGSPIHLVYPYEPKQPKDGALYDVTLKAGKQTISVKSTGTRLEMDDLFILEADLPAGANLLGLLTASKRLTVAVGKDVTELPLEGAAIAGSALFEICGR